MRYVPCFTATMHLYWWTLQQGLHGHAWPRIINNRIYSFRICGINWMHFILELIVTSAFVSIFFYYDLVGRSSHHSWCFCVWLYRTCLMTWTGVYTILCVCEFIVPFARLNVHISFIPIVRSSEEIPVHQVKRLNGSRDGDECVVVSSAGINKWKIERAKTKSPGAKERERERCTVRRREIKNESSA